MVNGDAEDESIVALDEVMIVPETLDSSPLPHDKSADLLEVLETNVENEIAQKSVGVRNVDDPIVIPPN